MDYQFFREKGYFKFPPILQIEITQKCPLSCPQCYKNLDEKEMPFDFLKDSIINASRNGTKHIVLNGGEPFVYSKIFDVLEIVDRLDVQVTLFTSGYGIHLEEVQALKVYQNLHIGVSFNGSCEAIHSLSRDGFDISYSAAKLFAEQNLHYFINWVARHDNVMDFEDLILFAQKNKADFINIVGNKLDGTGKIFQSLTRADYEYLKKVIINNRSICSIQNCYNTLQVFCYGANKSHIIGCAAGITFCCINVDGSFMPCTHLYYPEKYSDLNQYWEKSKVLYMLRHRKTTGRCSTCINSPYCNFCKAMSEQSYRNFDIGLPNCVNYQKEKI